MPQSSSFAAPEHWSPLARRIYGKQYRRLAGVPMGVLSALNAAKTGQPGVLNSDVVENILDLVRFRSTEDQLASPVIEWPSDVLETQRGAEDGVHATLMRLVLAWAAWGMYLGHFGNVQAATRFACEAYADLFWQRAAPNSPQWYNAGLHTVYHINASGAGGYGFSGGEVCEVKDVFSRPQTAACFILSVSDSLEGIMEWVSEEARVFKRGSGVGVNVSNLRALNELLSGGGRSSGLMSFLPIANTAAGAIKSGGTTRRAAKMVTLDVDHPDVIEFIRWKPREEARAAMMVLGSHMFQALKPELGLPVLDTSWQGDAMASVGGQNSNNSLMAPDAFMRAVLADQPWALKARTSNDTKLIRAREIMDEAVDAIWKSADPGFQFYDTINRWHVTPSLGPIRSSNPCVTGDTLVTTKNGLRRIDTLLDAPFEVMCGDGEFRQVAPAFATGVKPILRIELKDGGVLRCTEDHLIRSAGVDVAARDLQLGQRVDRLREVGGVVEASHVEVVRVVTEPAEQVFDLTEPTTSHFVANGVVIHNCAEYLQVDNSACNLASINLVQWDALRAAERSKLVERWTTILDITVDMGQYPNEKVARNVQKLRNLGLGISNLGAYLLRQGLAYDSDEGRAQTQYAMFEILGDTMRTSQELARRLGAYPVFEENAEQHEAVFKLHLAHAPKHHPIQALTFAPFRNAQLTLAAPTGTIGLVMGCETTGVEPMFAFEATKSLADGSEEKLSITSVAEGLRFLGLKPDQIDEIVQHTAKFNVPPESASPAVHKLLETASGGLGRGTISVRAHLEMMAALQPALSGAISKTVNMPKSTTRQEIFDAIIMAWRLGLKSIAFYRDGSKLSQPLTTAENCDSGNPLKDVLNKFTIAQMRELLSQDVTKLKRRAWGERRKLPRLRPGGYTRQVSLDSQSIYMHMGEYEDGQIGEVFLQLGRSGSVSQAMLDSWAKAISIGLQYGVPPEEYVEAFLFTRCEPSGPVQGHEALKFANSPIDLVMREIAYRYCGRDDIVHVKPDEPEAKPLVAQYTPTPGEFTVQRFTGDICPACQSAKMIHNGTCKLCTSCGTTTGCS